MGKHGTPLERAMRRLPVEDGFISCWLWPGAVNNKGYAMMSPNLLVHRVLYAETFGPVPEGLELDHLCRTPRCVNPYHLEPVTHRENLRRGNGGFTEAAMRKGVAARIAANTARALARKGRVV